MNPHQRSKAIAAAAALTGAAAAMVWVGGFLLPVGVPVAQAPARIAKIDALVQAAAQPASRLALDPGQLQRLCAVDWRRSLDAGVGDAGAGGAPMTVRLVGTVMEAEHSMAMLQKADGSIEVCRVGQSVDDAGGPVEVREIHADRVTVFHAGAMRQLTVDLPPVPGASP